MTTATISLDGRLERMLEDLAAAGGIAVEEIIREALEEKVASFRRPRPRSWGIGDSGCTDTAQLSGDIRPEPRSWR
jgi:hypothetical protein